MPCTTRPSTTRLNFQFGGSLKVHAGQHHGMQFFGELNRTGISDGSSVTVTPTGFLFLDTPTGKWVGRLGWRYFSSGGLDVSEGRSQVWHSDPVCSASPAGSRLADLLLGHAASGISDVLVKRAFVHRGEDDFQEFAAGRTLRLELEHLLVAHPGLRVRLRIVELYR